MYYVYALEGFINKKREIYVGFAEDLKNRVKEHLNKEVKTTKNLQKIKLVYYEACLNKTDALIREKALKSGFGRGYLKKRLTRYFKQLSL